MQTHRSQKGLALLTLVFVLALIAIGYAVTYLDGSELKQGRNKKTAAALAEAKAALLSFSATVITAGPLSSPLSCVDNCPRPGDFPCPDVTNNGEAASSCDSQASRLGRLPWKTLGLGDLRDGAGERLWYAVSSQYKNNTRALPLNSESLGTITLSNAQGNPIYDVSASTGLAAIVMAPGIVLTRSDSVIAQNRGSTIEQNIPSNYLEIAFSEDNANFTDGGTNGFISGEVRAGEQVILNDIVLPITRDEVNAVMEPRVLAEVSQALQYNFSINNYFPDPALTNDSTCITTLPASNISNVNCSSDSLTTLGRIPVGGNPSSPSGAGWEDVESNSILRGESNHNWFQQNGWREMIFYAVAPACKETAPGCTGSGYLTLENALTPLSAASPNNKEVVVISAGSELSAPPRNAADITDYLELEKEDGSTLLLNEYSRYGHTSSRNDNVISVP